MRLLLIRIAALAVLVGIGSSDAAAQPAPEAAPAPPSLRLRMLAAEDARDASPTAIAPLLEGLKSTDAELRRVAVRALGRLERPELRPHIVPTMQDVEASVRAEAADALAQSLFAEGDARAIGDATRIFADALRRETHPLVRGALAAALGRLRHPDEAAGEAVGMAVLDVAFPQDAQGRRRPASAAVLIGALRGLHSVALAGVRFGAPPRDAAGRPITWLPGAARDAVAAVLLDGSASSRPVSPGVAAGAARPAAEITIRRLAIQVLAGTRRSHPAIGLALIDDPDEQVRAVAMRWAVDVLKDDAARAAASADWSRLRTLQDPASRAWVAGRVPLVEQQITADASARVRFEALRALVQAGLGPRSCRWLLAAFDDADLNVARYALVNAHQACAGNVAVRARLAELSASVAVTPAVAPASSSWHRQAYALVGFAHAEPGAARPRVLAALASSNPWVRRYAALAADTVLKEAATRQMRDEELSAAVGKLLDDADANVATEAMRVLGRAWRGDVRPHTLRALRRDEEELLIEATAALRPSAGAEGETSVAITPDAALADACADALDRLTAKRRETSRDARLALVECVGRTGTADAIPRLKPLLLDFDPSVGARVATAIDALARTSPGAATTFAPAVAIPTPTPRLPLPSDADLARLSSVRVVLTVGGRGDVVIRLRPDEAPLNAYRFLRLAESGYYTGLTFHRIVPAFVAQGGSPLGNEFSGDGPFTRDEVGRLANLRGSVGLSTRGRDTGDAQFYVNLADNIRLDHTYTVFAQVDAGMDVVDALVEGDVIERVTVR